MDVQKGFDLLLAAFAQCASKHDDWHLRIIGEGTERHRLQKLADSLGIAHRVRLDPVIKEPHSAFMDADLFILSSRYEGFPNVLLEAMACGLPVISFDCPAGPGEIIRNGIDGLLVPPNNVGALANAMDWLMGAELERRLFAMRATEVTERFSLARVADMWRHLLEDAVS
jgi:glycosyltransferase involved in cell wall biosynthesis